MWRTLRNRHLAATHGSIRSQLTAMSFTALTGVSLLIVGYPLWRSVAVFVVPCVLGLFEYVLTRRIPPDEFDRVHKWMSHVGFVVLTFLIAITNGLQGPLAPFLFLMAILPIFLFGSERFVIYQQVRVVVAIVVIGLLPADVLGPPLGRYEHVIIMALVATSALIMITLRVRQYIVAAKAGLAELDRMREERLAEASDRLQRMQLVSSRIAHELKNPLAAVSSLVQLMTKSVGDKDRERLGVVQDELARMEVILRDYLSFSRPLDDLRVAPMDVADVLKDVREVLAARAETNGINFETSFVSVPIDGDDRRLKEALLNVVGNAIEATPSGGTIALRTTPALLTGGALIVVEDNGRGMTPQALERIGTPYFTTRPGGTGLGVHLARGVVAQHGGTMDYRSTEGRGTTVSIVLPRRPPALANPLVTEGAAA